MIDNEREQMFCDTVLSKLDRNEVQMCSDSEKKMSACAIRNHCIKSYVCSIWNINIKL